MTSLKTKHLPIIAGLSVVGFAVIGVVGAAVVILSTLPFWLRGLNTSSAVVEWAIDAVLVTGWLAALYVYIDPDPIAIVAGLGIYAILAAIAPEPFYKRI